MLTSSVRLRNWELQKVAYSQLTFFKVRALYSKVKKYNKKLLITISILVILSAGFIFYRQISHTESKICIEDKACFNVEIAADDESKVLGLSNLDSLDNESGMLFVFEKEIVPGFWMKDMGFPIDIIWINSDKKIIGIEKNLQLCENIVLCPAFYPSQEIKYVLEINANQSEAYNISEGDRVDFSD